MMKLFSVLFFMLLSGCAQLMHGEQQPVVQKGQGVMFTTCSGTVEDWGSCQRKARNTCPNGYQVLSKEESAVGGKREMTFQCN